MGIPTRALTVLIAGRSAERPAAAAILFPDLTTPAYTDLFPRTFTFSLSLPTSSRSSLRYTDSTQRCCFPGSAHPTDDEAESPRRWGTARPVHHRCP